MAVSGVLCHRPTRALPLLSLFLGLLVAVPAATQPAGSDACQQGLELFRRQQDATAESLLVACVRQQPRLEPLLALCVLSLRRERAGEAARWASDAVTVAPDSVAAHYWYGRALLATGDRPAAEREWNRALQLDAGHAATLEALARSKLADQDDQAAYGLLRQLARVTGGSPWVHRTLSLLARRRGLWREALDHWRDALAIGSPSAEDYRTAGELAIVAGDTVYAVTVGRQAVAADDSSAASLAALGEALFAAGQLDEAVAVLRRARRRDPYLARARFNLANVLELQGHYGEADSEYTAYVNLAPRDPVGRLNYATHLRGLERLDEALVQLDHATSLDSSLTGAWILKGWVLERLGNDRRLSALLDTLVRREDVDTAEVAQWQRRVRRRLAEQQEALATGKMDLLHLAVADSSILALALQELAAGTDFSEVVRRYSVGPSASRGGQLGWVDPRDMVADLRRVISPLQPQQVSPPVRSGGLYHLFKRVR